MNRGVKWGLIGCGGLLVLLVLLAGCTALIAALGSGGDGVEDDEKKGRSKQKQAASAVAIGEVATAGGAQWVVTDAQRVNELVREGPTPKLTKTEQGSFVTVDFDFTNNDSDPMTLNSSSLTLIDSEGRESNHKTDASTYIPEDRKILLEGVNPGITRQGRVIFEVPPDAAGFQLEVGDTRAFGEDATVDLGF